MDPDKPEEEVAAAREAQMAENLKKAETDSGRSLFENHKDAVLLGGDGTVNLNRVKNTNITAETEPKPDLGQLKGQNLYDSLPLD